MVGWLCTLDQARREIKAQEGSVLDDPQIASYISTLSTRIQILARTTFVPYIQLHYYDAFGTHIDDTIRKLDLGRPILLPTAVLDAFGNNLVYGTDYVAVPQDSPFYQLQLISASVYGWSYGFGFGSYFWIAPGQFLRKIQVTGQWGYRMGYPAEGWTDSLLKINNNSVPVSASATTITLTSSTSGTSGIQGFDANAQSPSVSVGNLLQVGNGATPAVQEWMQVVGVNNTLNQVMVVRGVNGTTAQALPDQTEVYTWSVQPEISRAVARSVGYYYSRRGAFEQVKSDLAQGRTSIYPEDLPAEVMAIISQTRDWRWASV